MRIKHLYLLVAFLSLVIRVDSQSVQISFCGKTSSVVPPKDGNGVDQRQKGGIRMDLIRVGKLTQSRTNPFYSLGISPYSFVNGTWVDGCTNNSNTTACTGCTTCKPIQGSSGVVGNSSGLMEANVRMRTNNDDLFIESTGNQDVVCFITNSIDLTNYAGKKIEVNVIYEGTAQDGFTTVNVNFNYKYFGGNWTNLLNQNSNFLRVIDTALLININVPLAVNNLDGIVDFEISPNPVNEKLTVELNSRKTLEGNLVVRDILGNLIAKKELFIQEGQSRLEINTLDIQSGLYLLQIADREGRISTKKFVRN